MPDLLSWRASNNLRDHDCYVEAKIRPDQYMNSPINPPGIMGTEDSFVLKKNGEFGDENERVVKDFQNVGQLW